MRHDILTDSPVAARVRLLGALAVGIGVGLLMASDVVDLGVGAALLAAIVVALAQQTIP